MLTKLLPSFIQNPDLNSLVTTESVELIFNCCAFFSLLGLIRSPMMKVRKQKKSPTYIKDEAIFLIDNPLDRITVNSEF